MMKLKAIIAMFQFIAMFLCLVILLFTAQLAQMTWGFAGAIVSEIAAVCRDDACQWMLIVCLLVYFGMFQFWEFRERKLLRMKMVPLESGETPVSLKARSRHTAQILLIALVFLCLIGYAGNYAASAKSLQLLTLLASMVVGKAFAAWVNFTSSDDDRIENRAFLHLMAVLAIIVGLLCAAAFYQPNSGSAYAYHNIRRWTGPWDNPNLFGLLMGAGAVLAAGLGLGGWRVKDERSQIPNKNPQGKFRRHLCILLCLAAVIVLGRGLYHSMSRGAWLGTAVGLAFLVAKSEIGNQKSEIVGVSCLKRNRFPLIAIALSIVVVGFWQLRFSKFQPAQRIASVANPNDFSWRNRVSAWQGAIQMMIDKPLTGFGWGEAESVYAKRYCTTASDESAAIEMNDYLMLGISGGVPVMLCFIGYVALAISGKGQRRIVGKLRPDEASSKPRSSRGDKAQTSGICETMEPPDVHPPQCCYGGRVGCYSLKGSSCEAHASVSPSSILYLPSSVYLTTTCRAGAIVLLVGFWFDGGLFKLPTAVVFWTLLELSRLEFVVPQTGSAAVAVEESSPPVNDEKRIVVKSNIDTWDGRAGSPLPAAVANQRLRVHHDGAHGVTRPTFGNCQNRWLSRVALCAVIAAVGVSTFYLFAPYLPVSDKTIAIARHYLILPKERSDFDFLAEKQIWHGQKLKALMDQAELANYNRDLVNWKLDEDIYRNYVLSPVIYPSSILHPQSSISNWRRPLWESFYPLIRHESSPTDAAKIVVKHLHERIAIVATTNVLHDITAIWQRRKTDEKGFQLICVAALRSVGVPARLNPQHEAEFYDGNKWHPVASLGVVGSLPGETN